MRSHADETGLSSALSEAPVQGLTHSCQHIYLGTLGRTHAANLTLAEAIYLARIMGLHDERLPRGTFDVVEREMRRRTFWLLCACPLFPRTGDLICAFCADAQTGQTGLSAPSHPTPCRYTTRTSASLPLYA